MKSILFAASLLVFLSSSGFAQETNYPKAKVSFEDFKGIVAEVEAHRASRLVDLNTFLKMSKEPGVMILDSRSDFRFDRIHVKGARQFAVQAKPLMMALNIPTYINLYGYGYRNVYELQELVKVTDPRIEFEGSIVEHKPTHAVAK